jgi:hypothetical protein
MRNALRIFVGIVVTLCAAHTVSGQSYVDANGLVRLQVSGGLSTAPGHAIWNVSVEPASFDKEISSIDTATGDFGFSAQSLRQVNPSGLSTVFADYNGLFPPGEDATSDSQFAYTRSGLLVIAEAESSSHLGAIFTGFDPIRRTGSQVKIAHATVPFGVIGSFSGAFAVRPIGGGSPQIALFENIPFGGTPSAGDYNGNDSVDAADYIVWRETLGETGTSLMADGNGDGVVDAGDYGLWRANFGQSSSALALAASTVPEPSTCGIVFAVLVATCRRRTFVDRIHTRSPSRHSA